MDEYFDLGHTEPIPISDMEKPPHEVFYLPMHAVYKDSSSTMKIRVGLMHLLNLILVYL